MASAVGRAVRGKGGDFGPKWVFKEATVSHKKTLFSGVLGFYGVGKYQARKICAIMGMNPDTRINDIPEDRMEDVRRHIERLVPNRTDMVRQVGERIKEKIRSNSYQGLRHLQGLSVHGQNTRHSVPTQRKAAERRANTHGYTLQKPRIRGA